MKLQIYILGVESRFRGKQLLETIEKAGLSYELVWGEDAQNKPKGLNFLSRTLSKVVNNREISMGEYCCAIGHQRILEAFVDSAQDWALILEEDAIIVQDISSIEALTRNILQPTILHLAGIDSILQRTKGETFWLREAHIERYNDEEIVFYKIFGNVFGAFGFLINREAAKIAVSGNRRLKFPQIADWPSTWRYKVEFFITDKPFISVETNGSELEENRSKLPDSRMEYESHTLILKLRGWVKLLKNISLLEPAIKFLAGLSFRSVVYENLYLYLYTRILTRLRHLGDDKMRN